MTSIATVELPSDDDEPDFVPDINVDAEDARLDEEHVKRTTKKEKKKKAKKKKGASVDDIFASMKAADAASTLGVMNRASKMMQKPRTKSKSEKAQKRKAGGDGKCAPVSYTHLTLPTIYSV